MKFKLVLRNSVYAVKQMFVLLNPLLIAINAIMEETFALDVLKKIVARMPAKNVNYF